MSKYSYGLLLEAKNKKETKKIRLATNSISSFSLLITENAHIAQTHLV